MQLLRHSNRTTVTIDPTTALGAGGEARVYVLPADEALVAKIYRRPTEQHIRKLKVMIANPPDDPMAAQGHVSIAWPTDLLDVADASRRTVGFLMPRATGTRPLIDYYNPATRRRVCPLFNPLYLLRTARNLAAAVHAVHSRGYVVGDVNESNILVTDTALVTLVDTDSFQVRDPETGEMFRCPVGKPEFTPPELQRVVFREIDRAPEHDRFGLAVLIFQLLMEGSHPYGGIYTGEGDPPSYAQRIQNGDFQYGHRQTSFKPMPVAPSFDILPPALRELFILCFEAGHTDPKLRPDAETWVSALQEADSDLVICRVNDQHRYGKHLHSCPWCARRLRFNGRDPFPSKDVVRRGEHMKKPEPTQYGLPSAVNIIPSVPPPAASPAPPASPAPSAPAVATAPAAVSTTVATSPPVASTPPGPYQPAIVATRGATARAPQRTSRMGMLVPVGLLVVLVVAGAVFASAMMSRQKTARTLTEAKTALAAAQKARSKMKGSDIDVGSATQASAEAAGQAHQAGLLAAQVLAQDPDNKDVIALQKQAEDEENGAEADSQAVRARALLDDVVQSIERYKNATLSSAEADQVRKSLQEKCRSALERCDMALKLSRNSPSAWVQRVRAYRLQGDFSAAEKAVNEALGYIPGDPALEEQQRLIRGER